MTSGFGAGLAVSRLWAWDEDLVRLVRPIVREALEHSHRLPPLGLVADVARLLSADAPVAASAAVEPALRRLEDRVVHRLLSQSVRARMVDAVAALPTEWRARAIAVVAEQLADDIEPDGPWWAPGEVRAWLALAEGAALLDAGEAWGDPEIRGALLDRCERMADRGTRGWGAADLHLLTFLPLLAQYSQRVAVHQLTSTAEALSEALPHKVRARPRHGLEAARQGDEGAYPIGGFSAVSTSGAIENLVASELVYVEDGEDIDMFDVRWAEGELLYYTRDEAVAFRPRRRVRFVLHGDLVEARTKDPGTPAQRLTLGLALVAVATERVIGWLGDRDLHVHITCDPALSAEADLLGLALRGPVDAGLVSFGPADEGEVVWVSVRAPPQESAWWLALDEDGPRGPSTPEIGDAWARWRQVGAALLQWLA